MTEGSETNEGRPPATRKFRRLYVFAGSSGHLGVGGHLRSLFTEDEIEIEEIDILRGGRKHDLTRGKVQDELYKRALNNDFDIILASPRFSTTQGPEP